MTGHRLKGKGHCPLQFRTDIAPNIHYAQTNCGQKPPSLSQQDHLKISFPSVGSRAHTAHPPPAVRGTRARWRPRVVGSLVEK